MNLYQIWTYGESGGSDRCGESDYLENLVTCVNLVDMDGESDRPGESGDSYDNSEFGDSVVGAYGGYDWLVW